MSLRAQVTIRRGVPILLINGKPTPPLMVFVDLDGQNREAGLSTVRRAAQAGVHLVSFPVHATLWNAPGKPPDYRPFEERIEVILKENPKALLLPRFGMSNVPEWWIQQNPDETMLYDNGERGMVSVASEKWRTAARNALRNLVRHLESRYGQHIFGYHPCGQNTAEWFYDRVWDGLLPSFETPMLHAFRQYLRDRSATLPDKAERRAKGIGAFLHPVTQQRLTQFWRFQQVVMVEPLEQFARIIKEETMGRKLVVFFYGYTFELSALLGGPAVSGHLALHRLLQCKDVDILCAPISYADREAGGAGGFMAPVDSVLLHGKLWLNEDDTRTYLSKPEDNYGRADTLAHTLAVHQRNFAHIATRAAACWWMDLMGAGWLDCPEIWQNIAKLRKLYEEMLPNLQPYRPEIAVVVDEASLCHLSYGNTVSAPLLSLLRHSLYRIGAPVGFYLLQDVCDSLVNHAKLYLVLNAFAPTEAQRRALKQLPRKGKTVVWFYAPGFIRGNSASAEHITDLTGIRVVQKDAIASGTAHPLPTSAIKDAKLSAVWQAEEALGTTNSIAPAFVVVDPLAVALATFSENGEVAIAAKQTEGGGWSVYVGTLFIGAGMLPAFAKLAKVYTYDANDNVILAGNKLLSIHATSGQLGRRRGALVLPKPHLWQDALTKEVLSKSAARLEIEITTGQTRVFWLL